MHQSTSIKFFSLSKALTTKHSQITFAILPVFVKMMSSVHFLFVLLSVCVGAAILRPVSGASSYETCMCKEAASQGLGKVSSFENSEDTLNDKMLCNTSSPLLNHELTFISFILQCYKITNSKTGACYPRLCSPRYECDESRDYLSHYSSGGLMCKKVQLKRRIVPRNDYGSQYGSGESSYCKTVKVHGTLIMPLKQYSGKSMGDGVKKPAFQNPSPGKSTTLSPPTLTVDTTSGKKSSNSVNAPTRNTQRFRRQVQ